MTSTSARGSTAVVTTDRGGRYAKQLAAHLGRRLTTSWDDEAQAGAVTFDHGRCDLTASDTALTLTLTATVDPATDPADVPDQLARMEDVIGRHLVRFGARDELVATWVRSDGTPGPTQRNHDEPDEGHRPPE